MGHLTKESLFNSTESLNILNCIKYWYLLTQILRNSIDETLCAWFQQIDFIQCDWKMRIKFKYFQLARLMTSHSVLFELKINETIWIDWEFAYENFMTLPPLTQHHMIHVGTCTLNIDFEKCVDSYHILVSLSEHQEMCIVSKWVMQCCIFLCFGKSSITWDLF